MPSKIEEEYPKIVKRKDGLFEYHFKNGLKVSKVTNLIEAHPFSEGYARIKLVQGNKQVYKFLDINGNVSEASFYYASDYSCGRALCQKEQNAKVQFRNFDGVVDPQEFDLDTLSYKKASKEELQAGLNLSNRLNEFGFAKTMLNGKYVLINMMGEFPNKSLTAKKVINRGVQLYNFYFDSMELSDFDSADLQDPAFVDYLKRIVTYKYNVEIIKNLNECNKENFLKSFNSKTKMLNKLNALQKQKTQNLSLN